MESKCDKTPEAIARLTPEQFRATHKGATENVFDDGPLDRGGRYRLNFAALRFVPVADVEREGFGEYRELFRAEKESDPGIRRPG